MIEYSLVNFNENVIYNLRDLQNIALFTELKNVRTLRHGYYQTKKYMWNILRITLSWKIIANAEK